MKAVFGRGRYANVTSTLALVVALGGTAYAANTIRSSDIVNGQVKSVDIGSKQVKNADLGTNSVTSAKVKNGGLLAEDFKAGQLPAGATGATGTTGLTGPAGPTNVTTRLITQSLPVGETDLTAPCLAGERAVGGGGNIPANDPEVTIVASNPSPATTATTPTGWTMRFRITGIPHLVTTSVVCAA